MLMLEYNTVMSGIGIVVLAAIFITWDLARKAERLRLGTRRISALILVGGTITAMGFISYAFSFDVLSYALLVTLGPVLVTYALSESGLVQPKLEMLLQVALMVGSIAISDNRMLYTLLIFSAISVLLLMDAVAFYVHTPSPQKHLVRFSSWLLVVFTVLNAIKHGCALAFILYVFSVGIWITTLISLEFYLRGMGRNVQEGL
ncbi:hypothetical protein [Thermococcus sp.]